MRIESILTGRYSFRPGVEPDGAEFRWLVRVVERASDGHPRVKVHRGTESYASASEARDRAAHEAERIARALSAEEDDSGV